MVAAVAAVVVVFEPLMFSGGATASASTSREMSGLHPTYIYSREEERVVYIYVI